MKTEEKKNTKTTNPANIMGDVWSIGSRQLRDWSTDNCWSNKETNCWLVRTILVLCNWMRKNLHSEINISETLLLSVSRWSKWMANNINYTWKRFFFNYFHMKADLRALTKETIFFFDDFGISKFYRSKDNFHKALHTATQLIYQYNTVRWLKWIEPVAEVVAGMHLPLGQINLVKEETNYCL